MNDGIKSHLKKNSLFLKSSRWPGHLVFGLDRMMMNRKLNDSVVFHNTGNDFLNNAIFFKLLTKSQNQKCMK